MAANTFADYKCLKDIEVTLGPSEEFEFDAPSDIVVNLFSRSPVLMFRVRSDSATGETLSLNVELNGNSLLGGQARQVDILAETAARSFHETINREDLNPGARNVFRFKDVGSNNKGKIIISDVVVWYQREV